MLLKVNIIIIVIPIVITESAILKTGSKKVNSFYNLERKYEPFYYSLGNYDFQSDLYTLIALNPNQGTEYLDYSEGNKIITSKTNALKDSLLVTGFGYQHGDLWGKNMDLFKIFTDKSHGVRRLGSASIDICHVATGQADGFWEYVLAPWDSAAGILIAKESGCTVSQFCLLYTSPSPRDS